MKLGVVTFEKSIFDLPLSEEIEKGKKAISGETRKWGNETWRKLPSGKWEHVSESKAPYTYGQFLNKEQHKQEASKYDSKHEIHILSNKHHNEEAEKLNVNHLSTEFLDSSLSIQNKYDALNVILSNFNDLPLSEDSIRQYNSIVDKKIQLDTETGDNNVGNRDLDIKLTFNNEGLDVTFTKIENYKIVDGSFGGGRNFPEGENEGGDELEPLYSKETITTTSFKEATTLINNYCDNLEYLSDELENYNK